MTSGIFTLKAGEQYTVMDLGEAKVGLIYRFLQRQGQFSVRSGGGTPIQLKQNTARDIFYDSGQLILECSVDGDGVYELVGQGLPISQKRPPHKL